MPQIVVSQGRLPNESGQQGDAGVPGGEVTVIWDDFGTNQNQIMANTISPGHSYQFNSPAQPGSSMPEPKRGRRSQGSPRRFRFPPMTSTTWTISVLRSRLRIRISPCWA